MSNTPKKDQENAPHSEQDTDTISDLPEKPIANQKAESIKGGQGGSGSDRPTESKL